MATLGRVKKLLVCLTVFAGAAYAAWRYRDSVNRANAAAWAAGTDSVA